MLERDSERDAARREDLQLRSGLEQPGDLHERLGHVFEVVEDEERRPCCERVTQRLQLAARNIAEAERGRDGREDELRVGERGEVDEDDVVVLGRGGEGEAGLAAPARAGKGEQTHVRSAEEGQDRGQLEPAADERRRGADRKHVFARCRDERGILLEDPALERPELGGRLEAELVERFSSLAVGGERVRLAARPVEGEHPLCLQPLAVRMRGRERVELARKRAVAARGEVGVDPRLQRGQPRFLEPRRLSLRERLEGEVGKCLPTPELERAVRVTVGDQAREAVDVELVRVDADDVARRPGDDPVGADRPAERMHVHLERARRARGWLLAPDPVDQAVGRDDVVRVEQELREQGTRPRPAERDRRTVVSDHLHRPEQPEFHALTPP